MKDEPLYEHNELVHYYWSYSISKDQTKTHMVRIRKIMHRDGEWQYLIWDDNNRMLATWVNKDHLCKVQRSDKLDMI